jgi:hypothetical protein
MPQQQSITPKYSNPSDLTHFKNNCSHRVNIINTQVQTSPTAQNQAAHDRAFTITVNQAQASNGVITGTFLVNGKYASLLLGSGTDRSFFSLELDPLLD